MNKITFAPNAVATLWVVTRRVKKIWCGTVPYAPQQDISYTPFNKTATITEGDYELTYTYGPDQQRRKSILTNTSTGTIEKTIIYAGSYEKSTVGGNVYEVHYIAGGSGLTAINVRNSDGTDHLFYAYTDHLGSILTLTDATGTIIYETNYDAWGRERNPNTWNYTANPNSPPEWLIRGFTGQEHLNEFALVNMNGRIYDPVIGRMLGPDNFVQSPFYSQSHNRYTYALNNPLVYTDPDGEYNFNILPADFWSRWWTGQRKNTEASNKVVIAIASMQVGAAIGTSAIPMSNTLAIAGGSLTNSLGNYMITGGQTNITVNFGAGSYDFTTGQFRGIWDWNDLTTAEKIGYSLGTLANIADILAGFNPGSVELRTENTSTPGDKDPIGHSQLVDENGNPVVDWGPGEQLYKDDPLRSVPGTNEYEQGVALSPDKMKWDPVTIKGVNTSRISNWNPTGQYNLVCNSCVSQTSRALNASGVFNIGIHPYLLQGQMYLRSIGVRPMLYSYYMTY